LGKLSKKKSEELGSHLTENFINASFETNAKNLFLFSQKYSNENIQKKEKTFAKIIIFSQQQRQLEQAVFRIRIHFLLIRI
jgi:hypothetical protein